MTKDEAQSRHGGTDGLFTKPSTLVSDLPGKEEDLNMMRYIKWSIWLVFLIVTGCAFISVPLFPPVQPLQEQVL